MAYAELHCLSNFSFLRGASHPEELVLTAAQLGYEALALTDECSVAGIVKAHTLIKQERLPIKLIVGSEFRLDTHVKLILLCPDRSAYAELCDIITLGRRRSPKGQYELCLNDFTQLQHCLLLWPPSGHEESDQMLLNWLQQQSLAAWITVERSLDHRENITVHAHQHYCEQLACQAGLPIVCAGNVHMHCPERQPLQDTLTAIRLNAPVSELGYALFPNAEHSLRPLDKLERLFPAAWRNETLRIAQRCQFDLASLRYEYPAELVPKGFTASRYLKKLVEQGITRRFPHGVSLDIQRTIRRELQLIKEQGYEYFFLTIYDIVQFAKQRGILYQGRGSAANSIVCYCLEITAVDPRQINVLFERFISKERNEPPDIDVDFEHQRREEIFQYIYQKYGRERAALAATVITFRFRSALRSVGKALGLPEAQLDYYIRQVNRRDRGLPWQQQLAELGLDADSTTGKHLFRLTEAILGFPRHLSQHVGGFIISTGPLSQLVPVENAAMAERTVIQWDKDDLESLGLLKVDILALGMLSAIRRSFELIRHHYGFALDIAAITRWGDDPQVYERLQKADSVGVFQVESRAQMSMLPRLKPACYYDLVIQIAIVRPGPIQGDMVHPYLRRRAGLERVTYPSKEVEKVLSRTLGVPIFQEQVIQLAMVAAGFSGGEADRLRRAMASWRKNGELEKFQHKLVSGMQERGYDTRFAERIFQQICGFGEYGFPESHSASFAVLAYVSSWLKHYFPAAFYCGLLNSYPMGFYSPSQLVQDAHRHGVTVLPVDVNHSDYEHSLQADQQGAWMLRLGLRLVRGLSQSGAERLLQQRPEQGYRHLNEVQGSGLNKRDLEALASANALNSLSTHRYQARWQMLRRDHELPLFVNESPPSASALPAPNDVANLREDYAALGLSLDHHPITLLDQRGLLPRFTRASGLHHKAHQSWVSVIGVVTGKQSPGTAAGVTFFTLEDDTGNINVVVWQATARAQKQAYLGARILQVSGILEREGEVIHVIAGRLDDRSYLLEGLRAKSREFH
ncbi:MAG: error-prone DNA polymerase [Oleiphilaceae bacterium]|nr:error-prone DNA polymerase [Oleiphilaceae bacterium]